LIYPFHLDEWMRSFGGEVVVMLIVLDFADVS
jgi:hypothetical protein